MFLAARTRGCGERQELRVNVCIFPFTRARAPARRNNRNATQTVEATKHVHTEKMLADVFPAIMPARSGGPGDVFIQRDDAPSDNVTRRPRPSGGWYYTLRSSDANSLGLRFFQL